MSNLFSYSDSFDDPLGMMMDQSKLAFTNSIVWNDKPEGERFWEIHLHFEKEISEYLEEVGVFQALLPNGTGRKNLRQG